MRRISMFALMSALALAGASCGDEPAKHGKACDENTVCDGMCLIGMPGGICTSVCTVLPCPGGSTCVGIAGGDYCMPTCNENGDCRDGYACVLGTCLPPVGPGEACEEDPDCASQMCEGGVCSTDCVEQNDCPESLYCDTTANVCLLDVCDATSGVCLRPCATQEDCAPGTYCTGTGPGEQHCKVIPDSPPSRGTLGASCAVDSCIGNNFCQGEGEGDPDAYCTTDCTADADCTPDMLCRDDGDGPICLRRTFCEACAFDAQCGYESEKCVSADPAVAAGEAYCSTACDPDDARSCPLDSSCLEAQFCEATGTWVADCTWCSGNCGPLGATTYQCFQFAGTCVGDGELCAPCQHDGQCDEGFCLSILGSYNYSQDSYSCSAPCGPGGSCPDGYWCVGMTGEANQCVPRTGSCAAPSKGRGTCEFCSGDFPSYIADCDRGVCLPSASSNRCFDFCGTGYPDCPAYMTCKTVVEYDSSWSVCQPDDATPVDLGNNCTAWQDCIDACPTGPASCSAGAPAYCLEP